MLEIIHHIEDLQVACFALIFGVMALQSKSDRTIRFVWYCYMLATVVSVLDVAAPRPFPPLLIDGILTVLSLRYAILAAAIVRFTRTGRWVELSSFGLFAGAFAMLVLPVTKAPQPLVLSLYYPVLAVQMLLLMVPVLRTRESSTRNPRILLALLFFISAAYRVSQVILVLSAKTPQTAWWRDQILFVNSTVVGCLLPFTIVWMMNARDHHHLLLQSVIDPLTSLLNRRGLHDAATREMARYHRGHQQFTVAIVDIDHFKQLNDTHGHACGDEVLQHVATLFRSSVRESDIVARSGGEEFILLLPLTTEDSAVGMMERLRASVEASTIPCDTTATVQTTVSIGIANTASRSGLTWKTLHSEADAALYKAKRDGRNRVVRATDCITDQGTRSGTLPPLV